MTNINNLERQHREICEAINEIKSFIGKNNIEQDSGEIAKLISLLAGKLKIHLQSEDRFLYPSLLNNSHSEIKQIAEIFIRDMGMISTDFEKYKEQFNTRNKIINNKERLKKETDVVFKILTDRLNKEDSQLYPLIKAQG
ncbi:hemerythrin domain-containing protein [Cellulosilyticum sp. I15G10I2]|uniref:hemerythrin domain-containing protein n=1 Tax=Cellulosilyticum sp. I15G10I2 TaxID=1892843 RepID=UPI00085CDC26|nr:hemerythrin domain-containing protein [Cellulosilyticum sp. I15G10I2]